MQKMIIGHKKIIEFLRKSIDKKRIAHAYLFAGPAHLGKKTVALEFIKMLNGDTHADLLIVEPDAEESEKLIGIKQIRAIQRHLELSSYEGKHRIALVNQADRMTIPAANCLLKTLEEPLGDAVLILVVPSSKSVLPTISSRCQVVRFLPVSNQEIEGGVRSLISEAGKGRLVRAIYLSNGRPGLAVHYLQEPGIMHKEDKALADLIKILSADLNERYHYAEILSKDMEGAQWMLGRWQFYLKDALSAQPNSFKNLHDCIGAYSQQELVNISRAIEKTKAHLLKKGINSRLALEVLMLEFGE